eukprot:6110031-Lingulodinium_polyedra.AAC.1
MRSFARLMAGMHGVAPHTAASHSRHRGSRHLRQHRGVGPDAHCSSEHSRSSGQQTMFNGCSVNSTRSVHSSSSCRGSACVRSVPLPSQRPYLLRYVSMPKNSYAFLRVRPQKRSSLVAPAPLRA